MEVTHTAKEKLKLSLFADYMIAYIKKFENIQKKLLEQIREFSEVTRYNSKLYFYIIAMYSWKLKLKYL